MGVEDQETLHADGHHEFQRPDHGHSQGDSPSRQSHWGVKEDVTTTLCSRAPLGGWESLMRMQALAGEAIQASIRKLPLGMEEELTQTLCTPLSGWDSFTRMQTKVIVATEADFPIEEKRFCLESFEPEAIESFPGPDDNNGGDDAQSSVSQSGDDDDEDDDTSSQGSNSHADTEGNSPSSAVFEKDPEPKKLEPGKLEPTANKVQQCVTLVHCLPYSPPVRKSLYPTFDFSKWKPPDSLWYRVITTTELPRRPPGDRSDVGGLRQPKYVAMAVSRRSESEGWHGWKKEEEEREDRGDGGRGKGRGEGGGGQSDRTRESAVATVTEKDEDKPPDRYVAPPSVATPSLTVFIIGGSKRKLPSTKKPYCYLAALTSSHNDGFFVGGGGNGREAERGRGRGQGGRAGKGRGGSGGGGEGGRRRGEEEEGGGEMGIGEPSNGDEDSGEVEAVEVSSNCSPSDGRGIITLDETDPKAQEENGTAGDDFPKKIQPQSTPKKIPDPPPDFLPFGTTVLPFVGLAPSADSPVLSAPDYPPNWSYEEGSPLCSTLVCPSFVAGYDKRLFPYWPDQSSIIVTGSVRGNYHNTVTGIMFNPFADIGGMLQEESDPVFLPWQVRNALKECTMPILLSTELAIMENALPLKLFLEICILGDVSEHLRALFRALIECRIILRCHNIPFAVVPSSVFVDLRHMTVMMPHSFCIMEQTWEEFVFFALEVVHMLEGMLDGHQHHQHHHICEFLRSLVSNIRC